VSTTPIVASAEPSVTLEVVTSATTEVETTNVIEVTPVIRPIPLTPVTSVNGLNGTTWYFPPSPSPHSHNPIPTSASRKYLSPGQSSGLLSHHGFTPPRAQCCATQQPPPPPPPPPQPPSILLSPDVELTRVAPTAFLILSEPSRRIEPANAIKPPQPVMMAPLLSPPRLPPPLPQPAVQAVATTTTLAEVTSSVQVSEPQTRTRRQKPDDLVPPGCGLTRNEIVCLSIDDFNDKVSDKNEREILVLKDRRRRGKNRIAAKRSREKKMERLRILKGDNRKLTRQDTEYGRQRQAAYSTKDSWLYHVTKLEAEVKRLKEKMWRDGVYEKRT